MPRPDYHSAVRSLALPIDDGEPIRPTQSRRSEQSWRRRSGDSSIIDNRPRTVKERWLHDARRLNRRFLKTWYQITPAQRAGLVALSLLVFVSTTLFIVYNEQIFAWLMPAAKRWREMRFGWLILWFITFAVSFPPMMGYSSCVTIAGFVFGMSGWFIMSTATVAGSLASFLISRTLLRNFVSRLTEKDKRFAALSLVLKHDGLKLLTMIRICPLPYSLANGAISTIPTVTPLNFALATAIASPKLLLHVFVGTRLGDLAENGDHMDARTKAISYISIAIGVTAGIGTGYFVYVRTKARAKELEAEEAANAAVTAGGGSRPGSADFTDDAEEREAVDALRRGDDDISLHSSAAYDDDQLEGNYRDSFTDDEDAHERDVFDDGDGVDGDDDEHDRGSARRKPER